VPSPAAADMDAEFVAERRQPALQGADDAGGDAGGVPVHAHHRPERLEPEGMCQPCQQFLASVVMHDGLADHGAQRRHAGHKPLRDPTAVKGDIGAAAAPGHLGATGRIIR
jgi:hypothetical protein